MDSNRLKLLVDFLSEIKDVKHSEDIEVSGNFIITQLSSQKILDIYDEEILEITYSGEVVCDYNIGEFINKEVDIKIFINNIRFFYSTLSSFILANRFGLENDYAYIYEKNILIENCDDFNERFKEFSNCLMIISLLKELSNEVLEIGNEQKFLYSIKNNSFLSIEIKYFEKDIEFLHEKKSITQIYEELINGVNKEDKKRVFINELSALVDSKTSLDLSLILNKWELLLKNYNLSYQLYLEGFSVEKLKIATSEYFLKITEKIYESISKISAYLFGIPIGYFALISSYDFKNDEGFKNVVILIVSTLFFIVIYFIFCKNIEENLDGIEEEIDDFQQKVGKSNSLEMIQNKIDSFKKEKILNQRQKLSIIKVITIIIYGFSVLVFFILLFKFNSVLNI